MFLLGSLGKTRGKRRDKKERRKQKRPDMIEEYGTQQGLLVTEGGLQGWRQLRVTFRMFYGRFSFHHFAGAGQALKGNLTRWVPANFLSIAHRSGLLP